MPEFQRLSAVVLQYVVMMKIHPAVCVWLRLIHSCMTT